MPTPPGQPVVDCTIELREGSVVYDTAVDEAEETEVS